MTLSDDDLATLPTILFQLEGDVGANSQLPEGTVAFRNITYAQVGERELPLDLYIPKQKSKKPQPKG